jgi:hypothetical protein
MARLPSITCRVSKAITPEIDSRLCMLTHTDPTNALAINDAEEQDQHDDQENQHDVTRREKTWVSGRC